MLARLGQVLYWASCAVAAIAFLLGTAVWLTGLMAGADRLWIGLTAIFGFGTLAWLFGRAMLSNSPLECSYSRPAFREFASMRVCALFLSIVSLAWPQAMMAADVPTPPIAITSHAVTAADYPVESIGLQEVGVARVDYTVRVDGVVDELKITQSSGSPRLDAAAIVIVSKWQFL